MAQLVPGNSYEEVRRLMSERFGVEFTKGQITGSIKRFGLKNGRDCRFHEGHESHNKGKKGLYIPGSEKGWFSKGGFSHNRVPIGTERMAKDGYLEVKYRDGHGVRNWRGKHLLTWEAEHGPLPSGHAVIFIDGDKLNGSLDNLMLIERGVLAQLNKTGMPRGSREVVDAAVALVKLKRGIYAAKKRAKEVRRSA